MNPKTVEYLQELFMGLKQAHFNFLRKKNVK